MPIQSNVLINLSDIILTLAGINFNIEKYCLS